MSKFLDAFVEKISAVDNNVIRIAVIHGDADPEVAELKPAIPCQNVYSIGKAFTVTAIGILVDRGLLATDETIPAALGKLCPDTYHPLWDKTTVHMLLQHKVGLTDFRLNINSEDVASFGDDYLRHTMNQPLAEDHGTVSRYTDAAFYILSCVVENRAGMPLDTFLWREVFLPLGFREAAWSSCPRGHAMGATGLFAAAKDIVKLGAVYMHGGVWKDKRIVSQRWVDTVLDNHYELSPRGDGSAYGKGGMNGQNLLVIPDQQRVVAWQAATDLGQEGMMEFAISYRE